MFTSHTINSCKKMLNDYGEFNNFVDHMLTSIEEEINESNKVEQKNKETYDIIKAIRFELESTYNELKIAIAAKDDEKTSKGLINTLHLLEKLEEFQKVTGKEQVNFSFTLL